MQGHKPRSLEKIEERMAAIPEDSIRYHILASAKNFKSSWIELGRALYLVWKDKSYKEWGYLTFEAYASKEIGIRKSTALKLLKSYYFLEKEEPGYLKKGQGDSPDPALVPTYESVNLLRLAKNKKSLDKGDYAHLKKSVLDMGKDSGAVQKELTALVRSREELTPDEARQNKRLGMIKRLIASLKSLRTDIEASKTLPSGIINEITALINKVEREI